ADPKPRGVGWMDVDRGPGRRGHPPRPADVIGMAVRAHDPRDVALRPADPREVALDEPARPAMARVDERDLVFDDEMRLRADDAERVDVGNDLQWRPRSLQRTRPQGRGDARRRSSAREGSRR